MLHNIFSARFLEENKEVIHTYDLGAEFLNHNCSLSQGHFGPKRAITLGQCCYAFHVICIAEHSLRLTMCYEY
jgi:hypothetical protein